MGMMDKFRGWMGVNDDDDYEDDYDLPMEKEVEVSRKRAPKDIRERDVSVMDNPYVTESESMKRGNKVVNIAATTQLSVVLVKPDRFEDATSIADHLKNKRTVVLNLESTSKEISRRLVDFLSGVAYAKEGQIKRVANSTFIITPYNVEFEGDIIDELESSGVYF